MARIIAMEYHTHTLTNTDSDLNLTLQLGRFFTNGTIALNQRPDAQTSYSLLMNMVSVNIQVAYPEMG